MTGQAFQALLNDLNLTQLRAAQFLGVQQTSVNRWARGKRKVPGPVVAALECLRQRRELEAQIRALRMMSTTSSSFSAYAMRDSRPWKP